MRSSDSTSFNNFNSRSALRIETNYSETDDELLECKEDLQNDDGHDHLLQQHSHRSPTGQQQKNPFVDEEDMKVLLELAGDDLLAIKIPNLQNYRVQPLELFDTMLAGDTDPNELLKDDGVIRAFSRWLTTEGTVFWKDCEIISYDSTSKRFTIKWCSNNKLKEVTQMVDQIISQGVSCLPGVPLTT